MTRGVTDPAPGKGAVTGPGHVSGPAALEARHVTVRRGSVTAVEDATLLVPPGSTVGLVGPNGSGKTSLLRVLAGLAPPDAGQVRCEGRNLAGMSSRERARRIAYVGQTEHSDAPFTTRQILRLSRGCLRRDWERLTGDDEAIVDDILDRMELRALAERRVDVMSGGERQRVLIARALAQSTPIILLDEPTNHLDVAHRQHTLGLLADGPQSVVVVLHDLDLAAAFCDQVVMIDRGRVVADGTPEQALAPSRVERVYGVPTRRIDLGHRPHLVLGR